ncbi:hypothetical protein CUT44_17805 [Streptomyces carminius]|uniref:Uncharacterized protein n=1 Tax=Streptomyces carminius TaxID=2665496 RepID=A0A2M8LWQ8_9ACTN|nr:hypothetical protein [Streptomyces carminius]PJE96375.1 hypothetical protein CUT44_17805 [Streptomyces carminius]
MSELPPTDPQPQPVMVDATAVVPILTLLGVLVLLTIGAFLFYVVLRHPRLTAPLTVTLMGMALLVPLITAVLAMTLR